MNVLDEYDKGEPDRDDRRLTVRWKADGRNVMTDDGPEEKALHIATFASPTVAEHITELHNRTFGDGQDPPPLPNRFPDRPPMGPGGRAAYDALVRDLQPGRRVVVNEGRGHLPADLQRPGRSLPPMPEYLSTTEAQRVQREQRGLPIGGAASMDFRYRLIQLVNDEVQRRVTEYAAREPARIVTAESPVMMANLLTKAGWKVFGPDDPVIPDDHFAQINAMRQNLAQDILEGVDGARDLEQMLDTTTFDPGKPVDNVRRAFLAGYRAARDYFTRPEAAREAEDEPAGDS